MKRGLLFAAAAVMALAGPALAGEMAQEGASPATPLIPAEAFAPAELLPPPPSPGTPAEKRELAELKHIARTRTAAEFAAAKYDDAHENAGMYDSVLGVTLKDLPQTWALLDAVKVEEKAAGKLAKNHFARLRPWIIDPKLVTCSREDAPNSSYPSGHTTMAFSMGVVLAHLIPQKAPQIMARAKEYAHERLVCSMHFRADIEAGQALGTTVGYALLGNAQFRQQFDRAEAELQKAGVTQ